MEPIGLIGGIGPESTIDYYRATGRTLKMLKPREVPKNLAEAVWNFVRERCPKKS